MKRLTALLLAVISIFTLTACGPKKEQKGPEKVVLENVYLTEKTPIPEGVDIYNLIPSGDKLYMRGSKMEEITNEDGITENTYKDAVYITDTDFSEFKEFFTYKSDDYYNPETGENRNSYFSNAAGDGAGGLWVTISHYYGRPVEPGSHEWINENKTTLHHYNADGIQDRELNCNDIIASIPDIDPSEAEYTYVNNLVQTSDGNLCIITEARITVVDPQGKVITTKELDENGGINSMALAENGNIRLASYRWTENESKMDIMDFVIATGELKTLCSLSANENIIMDNKGNVYTDDYYVVSRVDLATGEETPILDWINSDINCDRIFQQTIIDGEFYTFEWDNDYSNRSLLHLTPAGDGEAVEKYVMTLAANTISSNLKNMIIDYNRSSAEYRIQVKAYGWDEGSTDKFDMDILSGNVPDIICLDQLSAEKYASKALLADLGEMLDADEDISRDTFLPNILELCSIKGKLYRLPTSFSTRSLIGKTSILGERDSWTWKELLSLMKEYPNAEMFSEYSRETAMDSLLSIIIDDFIDYDTGKSNFTDGSFAGFLEFVKTLPPTIDWETYYEGIDWEEYEKRYKENKTLLMPTYHSSMDGEYYNVENFGEPVTYIGYPTSSGNGHAVYLSTPLAISSGSQFKEQAWDFMKMIFEDEYQSEYVWEFPVNKVIFEAKKQEAIDNLEGMSNDGIVRPMPEVYYETSVTEVATANELVVEEEIAVEDAVEGDIAFEDVIIDKPIAPPYFEEETDPDRKADMLKNIEETAKIASSATKLVRYNDPMIEVIKGESAAFLDGKKSIDETCKIIESRVNLYLAENM